MNTIPNIFVEFPKCECANVEDHLTGKAPCRSVDHWRFSLTQIRKDMYNSTSAAVPSPAYHMMAYERKLKQAKNEPVDTSNEPAYGSALSCLSSQAYSFNSEPLSSEDMFAYRRSRSEHLLIRMLHSFSKHEFNHSFIRLSMGTFLLQKWEPSEPVSFPSPTSFSSAIDFFVQEDQIAPIDTFSFNDLFNDMIQQTNKQEEEQKKAFIPYTYTLGVRYTNPYNNMNDILVRGNIPLWCQTLFITESMRLLPIKHGQIVRGLLPFAKDIEFRFDHVEPIKAEDKSTMEPYPELLVMFERFAMELTEPQMMMGIPKGDGLAWKNRQNRILSGILYCNIPDSTAAIITNLASEWATSQGISVMNEFI